MMLQLSKCDYLVACCIGILSPGWKGSSWAFSARVGTWQIGVILLQVKVKMIRLPWYQPACLTVWQQCSKPGRWQVGGGAGDRYEAGEGYVAGARWCSIIRRRLCSRRMIRSRSKKSPDRKKIQTQVLWILYQTLWWLCWPSPGKRSCSFSCSCAAQVVPPTPTPSPAPAIVPAHLVHIHSFEIVKYLSVGKNGLCEQLGEVSVHRLQSTVDNFPSVTCSAVG